MVDWEEYGRTTVLDRTCNTICMEDSEKRQSEYLVTGWRMEPKPLDTV